MARAKSVVAAAKAAADTGAGVNVAATTSALQRYRDKRNFTLTPEPADSAEAAASGQPSFVIQKHDATRLHYDFRLELDGVLLSWAVPKGPSLDPSAKRLAVRTEDHPLAYAGFEGTIPAGQYGAGSVIVWDRGSWRALADPRAGLAAGKLVFELDGVKLHGVWELVRMKPRDGERQEAWLLLKKRDNHAQATADLDIVEAEPDSVLQPPLAAKTAADGAKPTPRARTRAKPVQSARSTKTAAAADLHAAQASAASDALDSAAPAAALPETLEPQLAQLASAVPEQGQWIYETKFDGYRLLVRIQAGVPRLITRGGHDWTDKMPLLAQALAALDVGSAWLDGEIVVRDRSASGAAAGAVPGRGAGDFNALQNAFDRARGARKHSTQGIEYFIFDLPYFEGHDLRDAPLSARRQLLQQWLQARLPADGSGPLHLSPLLGEGEAGLAAGLLQQACAADLEGLIAKRSDAPYRGTRGTSWLKLKCHQRQEFIVGGYTLRSDDASAVGSLMLGVHDSAGRLRHAGSVGTGWDRETAQALLARLLKLAASDSPFEAGAAASGRWARGSVAERAAASHWVKPRMVVEVAFAAWTPGGLVRHAAFVGVRSDKPARAITRDVPLAPAGTAAPASTAAAAAAAAPSSAKASAAVGRRAAAKGEQSDKPEKAKQAGKAHQGEKAERAGNAASAKAGPVDSIAGVRITHGERVIDEQSGLRKIDLVRYYDSVADHLLAQLRGRPVALLRAPDGVAGAAFFQKHDPKNGIPGLRQLDPALWPEHEALLAVETRAALLGAAQMNVIEFHTWNSTEKNLLKPDRMVFDLDPGEGVEWPAIREGAQLTRALLHELGLQCWLKTSGGKGLHLVVPLSPRRDFDSVKAFSKAVVTHLVRTIPERFVVKSGPSNRRGRIFVDYLRNGEGATTVAAYSARARPGLGVSMPLNWDELPTLSGPSPWNIGNAHQRLQQLLQQHTDPWATMAGVRQSLGAAMQTLGMRPQGSAGTSGDDAAA